MHNQFSPQCLPIKCIPLIRWRYVLFILIVFIQNFLLCSQFLFRPAKDVWQDLCRLHNAEVREMDDWTMPIFCPLSMKLCHWTVIAWSYVTYLWASFPFFSFLTWLLSKDSFLSTTMKIRQTSLTCLLLHISPLPESDWAGPWHLSITLYNPPDELSIEFSNQFK